MRIDRRSFTKWGAAGVVGTVTQGFARRAGRPPDLVAKIDKVLAAPVLRTEFFTQPLKITSIDLLKNGDQFLVRVRAGGGATGIASAHPDAMRSAYPILLQRVIPYFIGKDARDLEKLFAGVYDHNSNYKWQGLPFWVSVAGVEIAILDLLGKVANKSVGDLLGGVVRRDIAVYRASGNRGNSPEVEIEYLKKLIAETGAKAIKFRLGGRFHYNEQTTRRDKSLIVMTRKTFGDDMTLYADANSSYDVAMAIKIGRMMEEQKFGFFEEPVPFDYYQETKQVADVLSIPIAGGEQEASLRQFRWVIENDGLQIVQPDILYFGGMIRSIRVARMAAAAGINCTAHMSGGGLGYLYVAHFASCVPNAGPHQEYKGLDGTLPVTSETSSLKSENGLIRVPSGPGLGVTIDPSFVEKSTKVSG